MSNTNSNNRFAEPQFESRVVVEIVVDYFVSKLAYGIRSGKAYWGGLTGVLYGAL